MGKKKKGEEPVRRDDSTVEIKAIYRAIFQAQKHVRVCGRNIEASKM
jgi:hypothetical protein